MYAQPSQIQKENFFNLSGFEFDDKVLVGDFITPYPYNDCNWELSPWHFSFIFEQNTGFLFCELSHRLTNNRAHGWDYNGEELPQELVSKYFPPDFIIVKS